jgi:hypothetical protein
MNFVVRSDKRKFYNNEIEIFSSVFLNDKEVGNFLMYKKNIHEGEVIILESFEINNAFRGKGFASHLAKEVSKVISSLKTRKTLFFCLEVFPFRSSGLNVHDLIKFYAKYLQTEYVNYRVMVLSFSRYSKEECYELIEENYIIS